MKTTILAIAAAMMMSATAMAQNEQAQGQPRQFDRAAMMKARTEQMVKDYGLNEEQAKKLETLNTEFAEKMPMMRGMRGQGQRPQGQAGQGQRPERGQGQAGQGQRPQRQQGDSIRRGQRGQGQGQQMNFEEMRKNMEAYNAELQKIMTEEQYNKYRESFRNRMGGQRQGGGFGGGNRPQGNNQ